LSSLNCPLHLLFLPRSLVIGWPPCSRIIVIFFRSFPFSHFHIYPGALFFFVPLFCLLVPKCLPQVSCAKPTPPDLLLALLIFFFIFFLMFPWAASSTEFGGSLQNRPAVSFGSPSFRPVPPAPMPPSNFPPLYHFIHFCVSSFFIFRSVSRDRIRAMYFFSF